MQLIITTFFDSVLPVFGLLFVGFVCARRKLFDVSSAQAINRFVFYVALPALLFSLLSTAAFDQISWQLLGLYFFSELVLYATGTFVARCLFRRGWDEAILLGMASCFANHAFFVLPIAKLIYGGQAVITITAIIAMDTTLLFAGTIVALEITAHQKETAGQVVHRFIRNPVLISILAGLLANILQVHTHEGVHTFTRLAGNAAAPAALFSLGIILTGAGAAKGDWTALSITGLKVLLHPALAGCFFSLLTHPSAGHHSAMLVAAGPCGAMPFVLALQYKLPARTIGRAIIYSTVASLITLSVLAS